MSNLFVRVLRRADTEVEEILKFIAEDRKSPQGARAWYRAYKTALARLAQTATKLRLAPENDFVGYEVRRIFFSTKRGRTRWVELAGPG